MNGFLSQLILAARNDDVERWMQMLVIAIFVIVYALGSIIKARANRGVEEEGEEQERARRPAGPMLRRQPRPAVQPERRKVMRPEPVARKLTAKKEQVIQIPTLEQLEEVELPLPRPQVQPDFEELPEFTRETVKELEDKRVGIPAETPEAKYLAEISLDYDDPDKLRRAILHYEILGRPLSLRGPSEHIIGL